MYEKLLKYEDTCVKIGMKNWIAQGRESLKVISLEMREIGMFLKEEMMN